MNAVRALFLLTLLFCQQAGASVADALIEVAILEENQDFEAILEVLEPYQESGDADVEYYIAFAHFNLALDDATEPGTVPDTSESIKWAERAAGRGSAPALNLLSVIYENGVGVDADADRARELLGRAADAGDLGAVLNLSVRLYVESGDADPRMCSGFDQILQSGEFGSIAVYYSGLITYNGMCGQPADEEAGFELIHMAAQDGHADAAMDMGRAYEFGLVGSEDPEAAALWYQRAADLGHPEALWRLGLAFATGHGVERDPGLAVVYFRDAAAAGYVDGMVSLGVMYSTGDGVEQDYARARELYIEAAAYDSPIAYKNLAVMYALGQGVDIDLVESRVLLEVSIELGDPDAVGIREWILNEMTEPELAAAEARIASWQSERDTP